MLDDYAVVQWREMNHIAQGAPAAFIAAADVPPETHLAMQALQPYVDNSISRTVYTPESYPFDDFLRIYDAAYDSGLKGCTVYRPSRLRGGVLTEPPIAPKAIYCCVIEREGD